MSQDLKAAGALVRRLELTETRQERALEETRAQLKAARELAGYVVTTIADKPAPAPADPRRK